MKPLPIRMAQHLLLLLVLFLLSASLVFAQTEPDLSAARGAAAQVLPPLESGSWQSCKEALNSAQQLAASKEKADTDLAQKLHDSCAKALEQGITAQPPPAEQTQMVGLAGTLVKQLLRDLTDSSRQQARTLVSTFEKAIPENPHVRILRLRLYMAEKDRDREISQSAALMDDPALEPTFRDWVEDVHVSALLRAKVIPDEVEKAQVVVIRWLKDSPTHVRARQLQLEIFQARQKWPEQYALATDMLTDEKLTESQRKWVHQRRIEGSLKTGRTQELNEQDWNFMLEQITGSPKLKKFINKYSTHLLGIAFGIGWLWLFFVAWITRSLRTKPPGFWMFVLWATIILYASSVILAPLVLCVTFSLLGIALLVFAITGEKAPLGYLVPPQAKDDSGKKPWGAMLGWCVLLFVLIQLFNQGYALAYERVVGHALESQLVAKLLHTETLPRLAVMVLAGGIFVPFLEEVIFRGLLQDWLGRLMPRVPCVAIVSILFGLIHGLEMAIPIAFIGLLLSLLRLRYRSLWPCILLHSLNNSLLIIALHFAPQVILQDGAH